jgi:IclR family transcriptional regulator, mhp operon transcriptional activator
MQQLTQHTHECLRDPQSSGRLSSSGELVILSMTAFNTVRALQRGFSVLEALNRCNGAKPQQLAKIVGLPRPTVYRLLETMETLGYVVRSPSDDSWNLTLRVRALSAGFHNDAWVSRAAVPVMMALGREILWPVDLVTLDDDRMAIRESTHATSPFSIDRGMTTVPILKTAGGRAYLSFCPDSERIALIERLSRSDNEDHREARDLFYVERLVAETRRAGYGSRMEGFNPHTASISVPINWDGRVIACLTVIWIASALSFSEAVARYRQPLRGAASEIERRLSEENLLSPSHEV